MKFLSASILSPFTPYLLTLSAFTILIAATGASIAMTALEKEQLEKLDPATRLEQRCDVEAMERISHEQKKFSVDKVLAYAFSDPVAEKNSIRADGAAFRSNDHWYKLAFVCKTDNEHINIYSFHYKIGEEVPESEWANHYLVP
ncbi:DUF930 domain-containing protein [Falsochrobactrum sp. TDYN1]|uniref:DUF930 domain-containing protein n=1 Tax=Falsochrobactrum tianjinense TaxID=2706015 RepID=A0A949UTM2_9HYPH|nr:DUF930 domain-containing protein [Falsochrobactrum sp. TDYN1]MBV2142258.1 DUF930 domain-containing protein [Falsochrobactrum sp. TDYN1]